MNVNRKRAPLFYIALSLNVLSVACVPNEPTAIQGKNARTGYQNTNHQNSKTDFQNVCIYDVEHGSETGALSSAKELRGYVHYCHDDQPGISIWQFSEAGRECSEIFPSYLAEQMSVLGTRKVSGFDFIATCPSLAISPVESLGGSPDFANWGASNDDAVVCFVSGTSKIETRDLGKINRLRNQSNLPIRAGVRTPTVVALLVGPVSDHPTIETIDSMLRKLGSNLNQVPCDQYE